MAGYDFKGVLYTHIFEPSSFPVSAYRFLGNLMLLDSNLLVIILDTHVCKENLYSKIEKLHAQI